MAILLPLQFGKSCSFDTSFVTSSSGTLTFNAAGNYLYAVDDTADFLKIWDISVPTSPVLKSTTALAASSDAQNPLYHNGYLLIPYNTPKKLAIWNVSDPTSPSLTATLTGLAGKPVRVAASGTTACTIYADSFAQTYMAEKIDISTPAAPAIVDNWAKSPMGLATGIGVTSTSFVIAGQNNSAGNTYIATVGISSFNTEDTATDGGINAGINQDVAVSSDGLLAFTTNANNVWVTSWSIADTTNIIMLDQQTLTGTAFGINYLAYRSRNGFLYVGRGAGGGLEILIVDASNPAAMSIAGTISTTGETVIDIEIIDDECATLVYAQGTGSAIYLKGQPPTS